MKRIYQILFLCCLTVISMPVFSQITFGELDDPNPNAVLDLRSGGDKGLLLPRLELVDIYNPAPLNRHVAGMVIYNVAEEPGAPVNGYYFNDGSQWVLITDTNIASWRDMDTHQGATSTSVDIYQEGSVATGASYLDAYTAFGAYSENKGVLFPRLSTAEINEINGTAEAPIPDGLLVYNTDTKCFNYYETQANRWVSLCSEQTLSSITIDSCTGSTHEPTTANAYQVGVTLDANHFYTLSVRVNNPGPYSILITANNGYSFERSGTFTETGLYTLKLPGQGAPETAGVDTPKVFLNGADITAQLTSSLLGCPLPTITVSASTIGYNVICTGGDIGVAVGDYALNTTLDPEDCYIDIQISATVAGSGRIKTNTVNGVYFESDPIELNTVGEEKTVRLYANGKPTATGVQTFNVLNAMEQPSGCAFTIDVETTLGTFAQPAQSCLAIYETGVRTDGEYWLKYGNTSAQVVKTYCDMTNGGYTLLWSYSERTSRYTYGSNEDIFIGSESNGLLKEDWPRGEGNSPSSIYGSEPTGERVVMEDYRLNFATMKNVVAYSADKQYMVTITNDPYDWEDSWGKENRFYFATTKGLDPVTGTERSSDSSSSENVWFYKDSYLFGIKLTKAYSPYRSESYSYSYSPSDGFSTSGSGTAGFRFFVGKYGTHWDGTLGDGFPRGTPEMTRKFPKRDGTETGWLTFDPREFNNIFGYQDEDEINHLWGKCSSPSADDYSFSTMECSEKNRYPHSFNLKGGNYQGRYQQWWVK